jgi:hypothetical protein
LSLQFNPITGNFDLVGAGGGGGGGGPAERYTSTFNATTSWGSASGGEYTITIAAATHGKGLYPAALVYEDMGAGVYELVGVNALQINSSGDVSIKVLETPDTRFAGLVLIL